MKAVVIEQYGDRDQLKLTEMPKPELRPRDVLVEVYAASVNPVDWKIRKGLLKQRIPHQFPLILGWDVAGVVRETGPEVTRFRPGDKVFSRPDIRRNGTYAEYVAVDEALLAKKPDNLTFLEAASIPLVGLTAWQSLIDFAKMKAGERVLIHAGAGGVGSFAIQLAKHVGCYVATTASGKNTAFLKELGADQVIDYEKEDFAAVLHDFDIVYDTVGGEVQTKSYDVLKKGGRLVSIVQPPDPAVAKAKGVTAGYVFLEPDGEQLAQIGQLLEKGAIRPVVGRVFTLEEIKEAHELSESRHLRGKIVIAVKPESNQK